MAEQLLLSAAQVAERLELQPSTIKSWGREGRIPCIVLACNTIRYRMKDVIDALVARAREQEERRRNPGTEGAGAGG
jgi:predicted site-specific integrase-resolvase